MRNKASAKNGASIMVFDIVSSGTGDVPFSIVPYIGEGGIKWTANGIDASDAGRTQDGMMHRGFVTNKAKCEIECLWMGKSEVRALLQAIMPEYVTIVTDTVPWMDGTVVMTMYSNNIGATVLTEYTDGERLYGDVTFPLVER